MTTPRTDRAVQLTTWEGTSVYELVRADFARDLERELAQAIENESRALSQLEENDTALRALLNECLELSDNWPGIAYSHDLESRIRAALK